jgi:hypothetical protein
MACSCGLHHVPIYARPAGSMHACAMHTLRMPCDNAAHVSCVYIRDDITHMSCIVYLCLGLHTRSPSLRMPCHQVMPSRMHHDMHMHLPCILCVCHAIMSCQHALHVSCIRDTSRLRHASRMRHAYACAMRALRMPCHHAMPSRMCHAYVCAVRNTMPCHHACVTLMLCIPSRTTYASCMTHVTHASCRHACIHDACIVHKHA